MAFKLAETNICRRWLQDLGVFNVFCSARQPSDKRPGRSHQLRLPCGIFLLLVIASTYFCYLFFRRFIIADRCVFQKRFLYRQGGTDGSMVRPKGINPLVKEKQSPAKMTKTEKPGKNSSFGSAWSDTAVSYTAAALSSSCSFFLSFCWAFLGLRMTSNVRRTHWRELYMGWGSSGGAVARASSLTMPVQSSFPMKDDRAPVVRIHASQLPVCPFGRWHAGSMFQKLISIYSIGTKYDAVGYINTPINY